MRRLLVVLCLVALLVPAGASAETLRQPGYTLKVPVRACESTYRGRSGIRLDMVLRTTVTSSKPLWVRLQVFDYTRDIVDIARGDLSRAGASTARRKWKGAAPDGDSRYRISVFLPRYGDQPYQVEVGTGATSALAFAGTQDTFGGWIEYGPDCP